MALFVVSIVILVVFSRITAAPLHVQLPLATVGETEVCVVECETARCDGDSVERPLFESVQFLRQVPNCGEIPLVENLVSISTFTFLLLPHLKHVFFVIGEVELVCHILSTLNQLIIVSVDGVSFIAIVYVHF